jgi:hypothetical protein
MASRFISAEISSPNPRARSLGSRFGGIDSTMAPKMLGNVPHGSPASEERVDHGPECTGRCQPGQVEGGTRSSSLPRV